MIIRSLFARLGFLVNTSKLNQFDNGLKSVRNTMIALSAVWAAGTASIGYFLNEAAKMEQVEVAFKTMLGGAARAKELLGDLFEFARVTPFRIPGILATSRILLGMGVEANKMKQRLKEIGDVAAGLSVPLEQIALSYGKVKAAGYLTGYELQNLRRAGVPLVAELSKMIGKTREQVQHMVRKRQISFELFAQAFTNMTSAGGRFHDLMFEQAKTLLGIISNIKDALQIIAIETGKVLLPEAKKLAKEFMHWVEANKELIKLRLGKFLASLAKILAGLTKFFWRCGDAVYTFTQLFGGLERVLKVTLTILSAIIALKFVIAIGKMTQAVWGLAKAMFASQAAASMWPLLIGLSIISLILIIDDLYKYLTGWKGKTVAEWFDKKFLGGNLKGKFNSLKSDIYELIDILAGLWDMWSGITTLNASRVGRGFNRAMAINPKYAEENPSMIGAVGGAVKQQGKNVLAAGEGIFRGLDWIADKVFESVVIKPFKSWAEKLPEMAERGKEALYFPGDIERMLGYTLKQQMVTEPAEKWREIIKPVSVTIKQELNNVTAEDAKAISAMTGQGVIQSLNEIKNFKRPIS